MAQLFRNTSIHQIFGANTDVGKTVLTTALIRASLAPQGGRKSRVYYLKPVAAGPDFDQDDQFIRRHLRSYSDKLKTECLYRFKQPVSPHLAAKTAQQHSNVELLFPTDHTFSSAIAKCLGSYCEEGEKTQVQSQAFVETAGGVHSPTLTGTSQVEAYRPLLMPTILIGDAKLGGISTTIAAYEALHLRGYTIDAVLLFENNYYRNHEYLASYFADRSILCQSFAAPPIKDSNIEIDADLMASYYSSLVSQSSTTNILSLMKHLDHKHLTRMQDLESMPQRAMDNIWWPFVQHGTVASPADVMVIDSAHGDYFSVYKPDAMNPQSSPGNPSKSQLHSFFDASASWWTQAVGHGNSDLMLAAGHAAGRYGHVMFPQAVHAPALKLSERLLRDGPGQGWASRVFFSDCGASAMEVALKMALRATASRYNVPFGEPRKRLGVLGLAGSYHGDTIGAMDACQDGVFTCEWHDAKGYWIDPPSVAFKDGKPTVLLPEELASRTGTPTKEFSSIQNIYSVAARKTSDLAEIYKQHILSILNKLGLTTALKEGTPALGALVLEPVVMGAGGMIFVDPLFQNVLVETIRELDTASREEGDWKGLPVIFDEIFVGLYRLGKKSTTTILEVQPDISANAKILTGGLIPLAVTLASDSIFRTFLSDSKADALLHGHSYTAHPVGCEVANKSLDLIERIAKSDTWQDSKLSWASQASPNSESGVWSFWSAAVVEKLSRHEKVDEVMAMGTLLAIKFKQPGGDYTSSMAQTILRGLSAVEDGQDSPSPTPGGLPAGVHFGTLGNVSYFIGSLNTSRDVYASIESRIQAAIGRP